MFAGFLYRCSLLVVKCQANFIFCVASWLYMFFLFVATASVRYVVVYTCSVCNAAFLRYYLFSFNVFVVIPFFTLVFMVVFSYVSNPNASAICFSCVGRKGTISGFVCPLAFNILKVSMPRKLCFGYIFAR